MPTLKLILEYDGTAYAGWQRQPGQATIQQSLETAFAKMTQQTVSAVAAGRTDAGVHALGQVVSVRIDRDLTPWEWTRGLNAHLPPDISVRAVELPAPDFHARHKAFGKHYQYRIINRSERPALARLGAWHVYRPLRDEAMAAAARHLLGRHDFSAFETQPTDIVDPVCHLQHLTLTRNGDAVTIDVYADRFLKQMVRTIVGTLIEVGMGRRTPASLPEVLASKDRSQAGRTAPPHGLYLMRVDYGPLVDADTPEKGRTGEAPEGLR